MKRLVDFFVMKENGEKIMMIIVYDYFFVKNVE